MTFQDFKQFQIKLDSYYPNFKLQDYQLKYWFEKLSLYDLTDVDKKIDIHLKGEYAKVPPQLIFLISGLVTSNQKQSIDQLLIACPICKKVYDYKTQKNLLDRCYERCNRLEYIKSKCKKLLINPFDVFGRDIGQQALEQIDENYMKFLEIVYSKKKLANSDNQPIISTCEIKTLENILNRVDENMNPIQTNIFEKR